MKKVISIILTAVLALSVCGFAEDDYSNLYNMSFDDLYALQWYVNDALWHSDGWAEVQIPVGTYKIGEDIPEGKYLIRTNGKYIAFSWGFMDENGEFTTVRGGHEMVHGADTGKEPMEMVYQAVAGQTIEIAYAPAIFTIFAPAFNFKGK